MALIHEGTDGVIVIDDRYAPVFISTFVGNTDPAGAKWFMKCQEELALRQVVLGRAVCTITDATRASSPSPEARRAWAETMRDQDRRVKDGSLPNVVVLSSALIRGALTAIGWLNPEIRDLKTVGTMTEALVLVRRAYEKAGKPVPALPNGYELPPEARKAAASGS
jgi:hypothetical protein